MHHNSFRLRVIRLLSGAITNRVKIIPLAFSPGLCPPDSPGPFQFCQAFLCRAGALPGPMVWPAFPVFRRVCLPQEDCLQASEPTCIPDWPEQACASRPVLRCSLARWLVFEPPAMPEPPTISFHRDQARWGPPSGPFSRRLRSQSFASRPPGLPPCGAVPEPQPPGLFARWPFR